MSDGYALVLLDWTGLGGKGGLAGWRLFSFLFLYSGSLAFGLCIASAGIWVGGFLVIMFMFVLFLSVLF